MKSDEKFAEAVAETCVVDQTGTWLGLAVRVTSTSPRFSRTTISVATGTGMTTSPGSPERTGWLATQVLQHQYTSSVGVRDIVLALTAGHAVRGGAYNDPGEVTAHEIAPADAGSFDELLPSRGNRRPPGPRKRETPRRKLGSFIDGFGDR